MYLLHTRTPHTWVDNGMLLPHFGNLMSKYMSSVVRETPVKVEDMGDDSQCCGTTPDVVKDEEEVYVKADETPHFPSTSSKNLSYISQTGRHKCSWCTTCFSSEDVLFGHRRQCNQRPAGVTCTGDLVSEGASGGGGKVNQCPECGKVLSSTQALQNHMLIHKGLKPFGCDECGMRFNLKSTLKIHLLTHTGELPHKCGVCGKGFARKFTLTNHMRTHTGTAPYVCEVCEKGFAQKITLTRHMRTHTGATPYVCRVCERAFARKCALTEHMHLHSGAAPYKCEVCSEEFNARSTLRNHKLLHTGEKPYECPVCKQTFTQKGNTERHVKRVHPSYNA